MTARSQRPTPGFFWHGLLILLPVALLAGLGLVLVREDQRLAEQDARQRAEEIVRQIAPRLGHGVAEALRDPEVAIEPAGGLPDFDQLWRRLNEADGAAASKRSIDPSRMVGPALVRESGEWLFPAPWNEPPTPPEWFVNLADLQARAWTDARAAEWSGASESDVADAWKRVLEAKPGREAEACAEFALLRLQARTNSAAEAVERFITFGREHAGLASETGLPLEAISLASALHRSEEIGVDEPLFRGLAGSILRPSLLTPGFLAEAARLAESSPAAVQAISALTSAWERQEELRTLLTDLGEQVELEGLPSAVAWFDSGPDRWFAVLAPEQPDAQLAGELNFGTNWATAISFYPKRTLVDAFNQVQPAASLPPYFAVTAELEGEPVLERHSKTADSKPAPVLALISGTLSNLVIRPLAPSETAAGSDRSVPEIRFRLGMLLVDPAALYARQRQRALWFGGFILAAAGVAMLGFVRARRAFLRERQLSEMKSNFVSSVSHELRAPIASVRLLAESLDLGKVQDPEKQRTYFRFIVQECRRLSALIANVLDFSRIEQGRKQYEFEPTDLPALVRETVGVLQAYASERSVELALEFPAPGGGAGLDTGLQPVVDGRAIQQALVNLIDNALKHSPRNSTVQVGMNLEDARSAGREDKACVRIWVADQGPGIPASERERIFERFYRVGSELRRETQGVGIGLSIVKHIVEAHGGGVTVESEMGKGSRFTMEMPVTVEKVRQSPAADEP
ncbi:MAG: sensor histidine kinase [Verrucomicrobiia bacterium]